MRLLIQIKGRTEAGDDFRLCGKLNLENGRIPVGLWFLSERLRRHLQRRIEWGRERGRVRLPKEVVLAWKLKARGQ